MVPRPAATPVAQGLALAARVAERVTTTNSTITVGIGIKVRRLPRARMLTRPVRTVAAVAGRRVRAAAGPVVATATDRDAARVGLTVLRDSG
jgi:hypothetical protein